MSNAYTKRLQELNGAKEARLQRRAGLPMGRPGVPQTREVAESLKRMAGQPTNPNQAPEQPQIPNSGFKTAFDQYSKNPEFKNGMAEFATIMQTMKKDLGGINLPPEMLRKRVEKVVNQYVQGSRNMSPEMQQQAAMYGQVDQQIAQQPTEPQQDPMGGMNGY